ncbi:hypothetical protein HOLleu_43721 [Holothuria leucospilota]|uniref:Uncharacterized protein n=1 Tax=Holothuria leucospilota TaxID=206669 RepID=A0A9Q0Y9D0_HOLLE|nr:hypothetical protein HOLleu_43721 [Holothuria leucospilota]
MEMHKGLLKFMCRLCGGKASERNLTEKYKFKKDVFKAFSIDFANDSSDIHPPSMCDCCRLKISRWNKLKARKPLNIALWSNFVAHGDSCMVCQEQQWSGDTIIKFCRSRELHTWSNRHGRVVAITTDDDGRCILKRLEICPDDKSISIEVLGHPVDHSISTVEGAVSYIFSLNICIGIPDFPSIAEENIRDGIKNRETALGTAAGSK